MEAMETSEATTTLTTAYNLDGQNIAQECTENDIRNLYNSLGITPNDHQIKYNAIHIRSSNDMTVQDVINYFSAFNPEYVEVVDNESCNIVWYDQSQAAKALFCCSQLAEGVPVQATRDSVISNMQIPPGYWLVGRGHINLNSVLLRFSQKGDRRPRNTVKCSQYSRNNNPTPKSEPVNQKNPWGNLSQCWDEDYELSGRYQRRNNQDDPRNRVQLKARRRNNK